MFLLENTVPHGASQSVNRASRVAPDEIETRRTVHARRYVRLFSKCAPGCTTQAK